MKTYSGIINKLPENGILVFGSNTQGRHGKGTAKKAKDEYGAIYGIAYGPQGRSFAIVTKDLTAITQPSVSKNWIIQQIEDLYRYASAYPAKDFYIPYTAKGINYNFYTPTEMAEMFNRENIPDNIVFQDEFLKLMDRAKWEQKQESLG